MRFFLPFFFIGLFIAQSCSRGNSSTSAISTSATGESMKSTNTDTIQVPGPVLNKFTSLFPGITKVEWELEGNNYEATFQQDPGKKSVLFSPDGEPISSETEINTNSLPEAMLSYIAEHLANKKIDKAIMGVTETHAITYEVTVEGKEYIFDGAGQFLKTEAPEGDEQD